MASNRQDWQDALMRWYAAEGRDLPWRQTREPYPVWLSEVMLQQTQVATALPYYERFLARFPSLESLASADEAEVLSLWQGLGYYRRCRNLLAGARFVLEHGMPSSFENWLKVPGVGQYTAAALASICTGQAVGVVDGNVERVFARFAICSGVGTALHRAAWQWAQEHVDPKHPGDWNQAVMELGARVCRPRTPLCASCPISAACQAYVDGNPERFPVRPPKRDSVELVRELWIPICSGRVGVRQIPAGEWSEGMWEFPWVNSDADASADLAKLVGVGQVTAFGEVRHTITHHRLRIRVSLCQVKRRTRGLKWVEVSELASLPMPSSMRKAWKLLGGLYSPTP